MHTLLFYQEVFRKENPRLAICFCIQSRSTCKYIVEAFQPNRDGKKEDRTLKNMSSRRRSPRSRPHGAKEPVARGKKTVENKAQEEEETAGSMPSTSTADAVAAADPGNDGGPGNADGSEETSSSKIKSTEGKKAAEKTASGKEKSPAQKKKRKRGNRYYKASVYECGMCGEKGHTRPTCPNAEKQNWIPIKRTRRRRSRKTPPNKQAANGNAQNGPAKAVGGRGGSDAVRPKQSADNGRVSPTKRASAVAIGKQPVLGLTGQTNNERQANETAVRTAVLAPIGATSPNGPGGNGAENSHAEWLSHSTSAIAGNRNSGTTHDRVLAPQESSSNAMRNGVESGEGYHSGRTLAHSIATGTDPVHNGIGGLYNDNAAYNATATNPENYNNMDYVGTDQKYNFASPRADVAKVERGNRDHEEAGKGADAAQTTNGNLEGADASLRSYQSINTALHSGVGGEQGAGQYLSPFTSHFGGGNANDPESGAPRNRNSVEKFEEMLRHRDEKIRRLEITVRMETSAKEFHQYEHRQTVQTLHAMEEKLRGAEAAFANFRKRAVEEVSMLKEELQNTKEELERRNTENFQLQNHIQEGTIHQHTFRHMQMEPDTDPNLTFESEDSANQGVHSPQLSYQAARNGERHLNAPHNANPHFSQQPGIQNSSTRNWYNDGNQDNPGSQYHRQPASTTYPSMADGSLVAMSSHHNNFQGKYGAGNVFPRSDQSGNQHQLMYQM